MAIQILKQSVGIDVSKDSLSVCFSRQQTDQPFVVRARKTFKNNRSGLTQLKKWIERQSGGLDLPLHLAMEATGVYYEEAAYFLHEHGFRVSVLLPNHAKHFAKSLTQKGKSDKTDAQMLAQMALERQLPEWNPPSASMLKIKRLCRERQSLLVQKTAGSNRLHALQNAYKPNKEMLKRAKEHIKFIEMQIKAVERAIKKCIKSDPDIERRIKAVCSICGISTITAATIVSETNGFALFKNKAQVVSYAGYDVIKEQSGTSINTPGRISKKGNTHIRKALYFPAITAVRLNSSMKKMFNRVMEKTHIKMKGYVAVQRKLLVLIYTIYKSGQDFDPDYVSVKNTYTVK